MKRLCAKAALELVPDQGVVGLGGGETIGYLAEYIKESGKCVKVVTPSKVTEETCKKLGIPVIETKEVNQVEISFDGCDQVDSQLNAYKSGGGIHTLEKVIARMSKEYVLLVDESKVCECLGNTVPIVLDIVPESVQYVTAQAEAMGAVVKVRDAHLLELYFEKLPDLKTIDGQLKQITGVIETSLFYQIASNALVAGEEGVRVLKAEC